MKVAVVLATLLVSSSALFMNSRPQPGMSVPVSNGGPSPPSGGSMPDMGLVMRMVRQILMMLLPKLMADPSLMTTIIAGGKAPDKQGPVAGAGAVMGGVPPPSPFMGGNPGPMAMGGNPGPMGGNPGPMGGNPGPMGGGNPFGLNPMNIFHPRPSPPVAPSSGPVIAGMGGPALMSSGSDKMKDMRLMMLLQDPSVGLNRDPYIRQFIPRGGRLPYYGWSLPDMAKDQIIYSIQRRAAQKGNMSPKEREIVSLIGDPVEIMPMMMGAPATNTRPL